MDLLESPTHCSAEWSRIERGDFTYSGSEHLQGLACLTQSPLRRYQLQGVELSELVNSGNDGFWGQLYSQLYATFPLQGVRIERTLDGQFLVLALLDDQLAAEDAVERLDLLYPWFVAHSPSEEFLLDFRRM